MNENMHAEKICKGRREIEGKRRRRREANENRRQNVVGKAKDFLLIGA